MDNRDVIRNFVRLLETANGLGEQTPKNFVGNGYSGFAMRGNQPDSFLGPIGDIAARAIPGLGVKGINGQYSPIFKTNFRFGNSGMSGFDNMMRNQNDYVHQAAAQAQRARMDRSWQQMFGDNSLIQKAIDAKNASGNYIYSDKNRSQWHAVASFLGSPMAAPFGEQIMNGMLGYDRGVSSQIMNAASYGMAAGFGRYAGGRDASGLHGRLFSPTAGGGLRMHMIDPFSRDFQDTRASLASLGSSAVQQMMYNGIIKKGSMHGASESFVSDILKDAISSGDIDGLLGGDGAFSSLVDNHKNISRELDSTEARKQEATEKLAEARKRGDSSAISKLENDIKNYDKLLEDLGKQADELGGKIAKAAEPLVDAVTGVVSSLKDFYGTEDEARRALDALTGGKGSKDKTIAERVHRQMDEIKMFGMMAGLDPTVMGKHLESVADSFGLGSGKGSKLAMGSGYDGQIALNLEQMFAKQLSGAAGDPTKQNLIMNAQSDYAKAAGKSEGNDFATLLMIAKKNGAFKGREHDFDRLKNMVLSGRYGDLQNAWRQLANIGFGGMSNMNALRRDKSAMALARSEFSGDEAAEAGELFAGMHAGEVGRMGMESGYSSAEKRRRNALKDAGVSMTGVNSRVGAGEFDAIMRSLGEIGLGDDGAAVVRDAMQRDFEDEYNRNGHNVEKAKMAVARRYHSEYASDFLTSKSRDIVGEAASGARMSGLRNADYFSDSHGNAVTIAGTGMMHQIGAAGSDGRVTKTALIQATRNIGSYIMRSKGLRGKDGGALDRRAIGKKLAAINKLAQEGKGEEAQRMLDDLMRNELDESSQTRVLRANSSANKQYRNTDVLNSEAETAGYLDELMKNKDMAAKMAGMSDDNRLIYAKYHKELTAETNPEQKKQILEKMKKLEEEAAKQSEGDGEKLAEAIQNGDLSKFFEVFKNGNVTMEQFFDGIKKIIGLMGGTVVSDGERLDAKALSGLKGNSEARAGFLSMNDVSMEQRLGMSDDDIAAYLSALRGGDVSERDIKEYKKRLKKAKGGDRNNGYKKLLEQEDWLLAQSEEDLVKKLGGKDLSDDERAKLEQELAGVRSGRKSISDHRIGISAKSNSDYKEEAKRLAAASPDIESKKQKNNDGGIDNSTVNSLITHIDRLVQVIENKEADSTQSAGFGG